MRVIEVTGVPAAGKTGFVASRLRESERPAYAFDAGVLRGRDGPLNGKLAAEAVLWILLLSRAGVTLRELRWIARQVLASNQPLRHRLNLARNCLLKLAYRSYLSRFPELEGSDVYVDEGVSHIPLLVQRCGQASAVVSEFADLFAHRLDGVEIICVEHLQDELAARLARRGHTRIDTRDPDAVSRLLAESGATVAELKTVGARRWSLSSVLDP